MLQGGSSLEAAMSLRKSPNLTPALVAANRRNAQKSTGPRSVGGKAQTRMNALRTGKYSRLRHELWWALLDAPPGGVERRARAMVTPEMAWNPLFSEVAEIVIQAERDMCGATRHSFGSYEREIEGDFGVSDQSRNVIENKGGAK